MIMDSECGGNAIEHRGMERKNKIRKFVILLFWLALWYGLAVAVNNKILLADPAETLRTMTAMWGEGGFYLVVAGSLMRIGAGFFLGFVTAMLLAMGSWRFPLLEEVLAPVLNLVKAIPVASFVVLLLIWWGSSFLAVAISFLVVLPNIYINILEGLKSTDRRLLEMAKVFRMPFWNRFFYIYRPALRPFLYGSLRISLGMCWKSGIAAEVIGTPDYSIGERMYLSKVYLDTAGVFAWTAVIVLLSILSEKCILGLAGAFFAWEPGCKIQQPHKAVGYIKCRDIIKSYDGKKVLYNVSTMYHPGQTYYLTTPSGSGKTTWLRILAGLAEPDSGMLEASFACGMVFQEDRLCEEYDGVKNVELVTGDKERAQEALRQLLDEEALHKPCGQLSGGMKRRVALARAMESEAEYILLDEPYTGMDAETRLRAEEYIRRRQNNRILIIATHI